MQRAPACRSSTDIAEEEPDVDEEAMKEAGDLGVPFMEPDHDGERGVGGVG